jgi:predicted DNA-binding transcriptional regulator
VVKNLISDHEVRIYEAVRSNGGWLTAREIAVRSDVSDRTARHHAAGLAKTGVFDVAKVFGGYRYRIKTSLDPAASAYVSEIEAAKRIMA